MSRPANGKAVCQICGYAKRRAELVPAELVRGGTVDYIKRKHETFDTTGFICFDDLNFFRTTHIQDLMTTERGELSAVEVGVLESLHQHDVVTSDVNRAFEGSQTIGDRISDHVATFGGSWKFIIGFGAALVLWMAFNSRPGTPSFDAFPFIFLNLILSCLAAIQAPVIMMSQNRQEAKDRLRSEHDYSVNLKAELEIRNLATKVDLLISHQWQHLLEIQQIQTDMMNELLKAIPKTK